jgi:serine phosphatase RsbU (regulator of sigma subunit)
MNTFPDIKLIASSIYQYFFSKDSKREYNEEFYASVDKYFSYFVFLTQFSFYLILFYLPDETVAIVFINHIGITLLAGILALFSKFDILVTLALNVLLTMIHIIIFFTIGQLQFLMNGALTIEYLNNFYISLSLLVVVHSFRFHRFSCLIPGITYIILHLLSLYILSFISTIEWGWIAFLPEAGYILAMLIGTGLIYIRRTDIRKISQLNLEKSVITQELQLAKKVQDTLFPNDVEINGLRFEAFRQSHNFIGGDFYDFIQLREGNIGVFLTDIAGHGISSAMVASIMKVIVATIPYSMKLDPVKLLTHLDNHLDKDLSNYHASAIYMFLDFQAKIMTIANAGHPYLIYCPLDGEFEEVVTDGSILGFHIRDPIAENIQIQFQTGDRFFIYTDGLVESPTETGDAISESDLLNILNKRRSVDDISIMKEMIIEDVYKDYGLKNFTDDTMFLLFEITERS